MDSVLAGVISLIRSDWNRMGPDPVSLVSSQKEEFGHRMHTRAQTRTHRRPCRAGEGLERRFGPRKAGEAREAR